ncbi:GGDEF domain-containing response regulator [Arcobacter peruensis]|uniref:GGDEF domain-containing response regulator n=1 Tax=Arcobacter peruensis TaxID=2320140 RepID=UPI001D18D57D|nr:diguanylate cyclase [Arcobacter peruensis]
MDDSISIGKTLKNLIESNINIEVYIAKTKKESAQLILEHKGKFDVILADLGLPDAPNGEVVDFLAKFTTPIVILTGSDNIDIENNFRNKNIVDYIVKDGISALQYAASIVNRIIKNQYIKILVVDDSKTFLKQAEDFINRYKLIPLLSTNGEDALKTLKENKDIKIVLTDYLMPKMDGIELTKRIRSNYSKDELSIIVTSNASDSRIPSKFLKLGANDFLYKGFSKEEFFVRINSNLEIIELFEDMKNKVNKDYMTGLYNRRYFFEFGKKIYEDNKKANKSLALSIIDIDNFKNINDSYGHDVGDEAIKEVAKILNKNIISNSLIARLGGEEFCILFYNRTKDEIEKLLEVIRRNFENNFIEINELKINYTVSIGCSFEYGKNIDDMLQLADKGLYDAKKNGRNQVRYR